jgi:uncharacterized protein (TIRG00374 family)
VKRLLTSGRVRLVVPVVLLAVAVALIWWRGPDWNAVGDAFSKVEWWWVVIAVGLNLLSVIVRAAAWHTAIKQALRPPYPAFRLVFSAFCVGLFANVVLPGRVGELARVAVLARRMPGRRGIWPTLVGSVVAHRMFDLFPSLTLVVWVVFAAKLPDWAITSLEVVLGLSLVIFTLVWVLARFHHARSLEELGRVRKLILRARVGLAIMREPVPAATAGSFQFAGWVCQLLAVWAAMRAFDINQPLAAAGLVLVLVNVATIFPLWPGNVGLTQAAIALPLRQYGVAYSSGFAFGIGLQAIEASVGVGIGLIFLAREGLTYGNLKTMPTGETEEEEDRLEELVRAKAG